MSTELWAESPHHIGTPIVVETSTGDAEQMSEITEQLIALIRARDAAGLAKYGVTLDRKDLTIEQWLQHQAEELADGAGYALAAMREVKELRAKMNGAPLTVITDGGGWTREEAISVLNNRTEERDAALAKLADAESEVKEHREALSGIAPVHFWLALASGIARDERDAAIARAEAAEAEARKARSVCEEIENYAMTANQSILDNEESIRHQIFDQIRDIARKGCTKCFSSGTYCELQEMKSANDELRREAEALKHCLVRHNCGKPECLCVKCCREEDARNALTPPV